LKKEFWSPYLKNKQGRLWFAITYLQGYSIPREYKQEEAGHAKMLISNQLPNNWKDTVAVMFVLFVKKLL
jgi:hypothetical protein